MQLILLGHEYKYAAEQMMFTLFPGEKPVYAETLQEENWAEISMKDGKVFCTLLLQGKQGTAQTEIGPYTTELEKNREEQKAVKTSFYQAALAAGRKKPVWGALTGVKPGKLMARYLGEGKSREDFARDFDVTPSRAELCYTTTLQTIRAKESLAENDVCLYVGIPFCPTRCAYCSFISAAVPKQLGLVEEYLQALFREIGRVSEQLRNNGKRIVAFYMGGGTPTTLNPDQMERLCKKLEESFDFSALREYTVEAGRPDTITEEKLKVLKKYGVSRLSVNPQTMSDKVLEVIGRKHTAQEVQDAFSLVRKCGNFAVNMDLIAGLPADSAEGFRKTLDMVRSLNPENITIHTLSIKKGAWLKFGESMLPSGEEVREMLDYAAEQLMQAGYRPYYLYRQKNMSGGFENVGWAKEGTENLYNICMMEELCDVIALGAGGSSKEPGKDGSIRRRVNPKYPTEYIDRMNHPSVPEDN